MLTNHASRKFLRTRALRDISDKTTETCEWALTKLMTVSPNDLPAADEEVHQVFTPAHTGHSRI